MNLFEEFKNVMSSIDNCALATSVDSIPNVRIVTFGYDEDAKNILYFTSFPGCNKDVEIEKNPEVTIVTLPRGFDDMHQVRIFGKAKKSSKKLSEISNWILKKQPDFQETINMAGDVLTVYEVEFSEAYLTLGMEKPYKIEF